MSNEVATIEKPTAVLDIISRVASDPNLDASKLMTLLDAQERIMNKNAEIAFNDAMSRLSSKMPRIVRSGSVGYKNKDSGKMEEAFKFARWEDIDQKIRPLLAEEGFSLSFNSQAREGGGAVITGTLSHVGGHSRSASLPLALDNSGGKNNIQGMGSTISYGKRYTATMLLNIVTIGEDDDGDGDHDILTNEQAVEIDLMIPKDPAYKTRFLKFMGVKDVQSIHAGDYQKAVDALNEYKKAQEKHKVQK